MKKKEKKETTYWNIKECDIDDDLLPQIKKQVTVVRNATPPIMICCALNCLLFMLNILTDISKTLLIVLHGLIVAISITMLILIIIAAVKLNKLKKTVITMQEKESKSNESSHENENETNDR